MIATPSLPTGLPPSAARVFALRRRARFTAAGIGLVLAVMALFSLHTVLFVDTDFSRLSGDGILRALLRFFDVDFSILPQLLAPALETVLMATLASMLGILLALPAIWLGAANITPLGWISYSTGRGLMTLSRSVHEIVWGLLFVAAVGLGALAGVLAMAVRSVGFIAKTVAEVIEDVDPRPIEALRAAGANRYQILLFGIIPQVIPTFLGNVIFEWDVNIRRSTIMGLVGAGGLGLALHRQMAAYNYGGIATVFIVILLIVIAGEVISHHARKAVI